MAYGDGEVDTTLRESWHVFCERVKEAGDLIFEDAVPTDSQERALGFQYLTRMLGHGLERMIEHTDVLHPNLWRYMSPTNKWGGDNPDALYLVAPLDGSRTYRIVGRRGTAHYHVFSTQRRWEDVADGESAEAARMTNFDLETEWDGSFELWIGPEEHSGNWLRTTPDTYRVLVRQFFYDWEHEEPMTARIELVDDAGPPVPMTAERMSEGLQAASEFLHTNAGFWARWQEPNREQLNQFVDLQERIKFTGGVPGGIGFSCSFEVQPDEVLLIEVTPPHCHFWNMELGTYWMMTHDYRHRLCSWNGHQATLEEDGSVRIVVAHRDPGLSNWLDTGGHVYGHIGMRWIMADSAPLPTTRLVKLADLDTVVPPNSRRIDAEGRREQLRRRKIGIDRRFRA